MHRAPPPTRAWWADLPPAVGGFVLATGVLSVGLRLTGYGAVSLVALVVAGAAWVLLAGTFAARLVREPARWRGEAATPAALTGVAATTVLGVRLTDLDRRVLAEALLALATVLWAALLPRAGRRPEGPMPGTVFLGCVATQGLAALGASLGEATGTAWLAHTAVVLFWLGLALYVAALLRFDFREVVVGRGDHWIAGGALGISALAGARLVEAGDAPGVFLWSGDADDVLRNVTGAFLALDLAWYAVLAVAEFLRPRLRYDVRRWSTVFPMGMSAVAALSVSAALGTGWPSGLGKVLLWVAGAAWAVVAAGAATAGSVRSRAPR